MSNPELHDDSSLERADVPFQENLDLTASDASEESPISINALAPGLVASRKPDGLILSTGNLYFTSHDAAIASVWRTSQNSSPGQEAILYCEAGARFGDIVFAQVDGAFWGYFFAERAGAIKIMRIPLTGGEATVLATVDNIDMANSHRNLIADGVNLYWQDVEFVRKMPIRGGDIVVLDQANPNTPTAGIALRNGNIVYASVKDIRFVPVNGANTSPAVRTIATALTRVVALHAASNGVYWADNNGVVQRKIGSTITTLQPDLGFLPTSISTNGAVKTWTQCSSQSCQLRVNLLLQKVTIAIGEDPLGATVTSSGNIFWGDSTGVHRLVL